MTTLKIFQIIIFLVASITLVVLFGVEKGSRVNEIGNEEGREKDLQVSAKNNNIHKVKFFDSELFDKSIKNTKKEKVDCEIKGGIVPHHLIGGFMIADFFEKLSDQEIETVIIIGPNHFERGSFKVLSSYRDWKFSFGIVKTQMEIIRELEGKNFLRIDDGVLENEHSIATLMPFIKYYLPKAKAVPLVVSSRMELNEVMALGKKLGTIVSKNKKVVLVASIDFSHYLKANEAELRDRESIKAIRNFDYQKILNFKSKNSEYLDSPESLIVLLEAMKLVRADQILVLDNNNSGKLFQDNEIETTSYFEIGFCEFRNEQEVLKLKQEVEKLSESKNESKKLSESEKNQSEEKKESKNSEMSGVRVDEEGRAVYRSMFNEIEFSGYWGDDEVVYEKDGYISFTGRSKYPHEWCDENKECSKVDVIGLDGYAYKYSDDIVSGEYVQIIQKDEEKTLKEVIKDLIKKEGKRPEDCKILIDEENGIQYANIEIKDKYLTKEEKKDLFSDTKKNMEEHINSVINIPDKIEKYCSRYAFQGVLPGAGFFSYNPTKRKDVFTYFSARGLDSKIDPSTIKFVEKEKETTE